MCITRQGGGEIRSADDETLSLAGEQRQIGDDDDASAGPARLDAPHAVVARARDDGASNGRCGDSCRDVQVAEEPEQGIDLRSEATH